MEAMSRTLLLQVMASHFIILALLSSSAITQLSASSSHEYVQTLDPKLMGLKEEKLTHFKLYLHDIYSGKQPSAIPIVASPLNNTIGFGFLSMIDDPLTVAHQASSKLTGKAQGFYGQASQEGAGLIMVMNFVFTEGKYNGSTIAILGKNAAMSKVREMPVVGGSGVFRFARGYVQASTYSFNQTSGDAIVGYDVYVLHY
ncbi:hypothetical protein K2173_010972 [Erythroxylum novogranatense]|uniref:Dirigent protein n=1 Tax=Erythroxylum novogranatense TaxID=1862640 RepID=A0AAV8T047_9ROSI|nr:hypothetical protein K2173_010972 [Erythroxylum novogranatense]